jgi:rhodanese-related sulfurtransferase
MKAISTQHYGFLSRGVRNVTPSEAIELCSQGAMMIDVRESYHSFVHAFGVEHLYYCPKSELEAHLADIPADVPVIMADASGLKSHDAALWLQEKGYTNVLNLAGGMVEWLNEKMAVRSDKTERLSGSCMCMLKHRERPKPGITPGKH